MTVWVSWVIEIGRVQRIIGIVAGGRIVGVARIVFVCGIEGIPVVVVIGAGILRRGHRGGNQKTDESHHSDGECPRDFSGNSVSSHEPDVRQYFGGVYCPIPEAAVVCVAVPLWPVAAAAACWPTVCPTVVPVCVIADEVPAAAAWV